MTKAGARAKFLALVSMVTLLLAALPLKMLSRPTSLAEREDARDVVVLEPTRLVMLSEVGLEDFTCTGLAYDSAHDEFVVADYGATSLDSPRHPRIIRLDGSLTRQLGSIELGQMLGRESNLQGIAVADEGESIWLASNTAIYCLSRRGELKATVDTSFLSSDFANGIAVDDDGTIWVLFARKCIAHMTSDGMLIDSVDFDYADQDHLTKAGMHFWLTVGADYQGNKNYLCKVAPETGDIESLYRLGESYAIEGVATRDDSIFVANDGFYHQAKIRRSYIAVYSIPTDTVQTDV